MAELANTLTYLEQYVDHVESVRLALEKIAELEKQQGELHQLILDLNAHTRPFDSEADNPNNVKNYLVSAGALHRVLGTVGHSASKCQAEDEVIRLTNLVARQEDIIEKAKKWWDVTQNSQAPNFMYELRRAVDTLGAALDALPHRR